MLRTRTTELLLDRFSISKVERAVKEDDLQAVVGLLAGKKLPTSVNTHRLLKLALFNGNLDIVLELMDRTNPIVGFHASNKEATLLHHAAASLNLDKTFEWLKSIETVVRILLDNGFDVKALNERNETPLHVAFKSDNWKVVDLLLEALMEHTPIEYDENLVDDNGLSLFHILCTSKNSEYVTNFLEHSKAAAFIDRAVHSKSESYPGYAPLHFAATFYRYETAKLLLKLGADPSVRSSRGSTPLHLVSCLDRPQWMFYENYPESAPGREFEEIALYLGNLGKILLERKRLFRMILSRTQDHDARDDEGNNALMYVAFSNYVQAELSDVLMYRDAEVHKQVAASQLEVIRGLLARYDQFAGDDAKFVVRALNLANNAGFTCLHHAATSLDDNEDTVSLLLRLGADPNAVDRRMDTPLLVAAKNHNNFFVKTLLQHNLSCDYDRVANIDAQDASGLTAAHHAFAQKMRDLAHDVYHHDSCFELLLSSGSDLNVQCENGEDVLQLMGSFAAVVVSHPTFPHVIRTFGDLFHLDEPLDSVQVDETFASISVSMLLKTWKYLTMMSVCYSDFKYNKFLHCLSSHLLTEAASVKSSEEFRAQCLKEIRVMEMYRINGLLSLRDVLIKGIDRVASYSEHPLVRTIVGSSIFRETFPLYWRVLKARFARAASRRSVAEEAKSCLQSLVPFQLPDLCAEAILGNCTEKKLRDVVEAKELLSVVGLNAKRLSRKRTVADRDSAYRPPLKMLRV